MVDFVKKKIVEKLARFTKNLKPSDISVSFLSGKGHLSNLELNAEFISSVLQLPSWVCISRVVCDTIRARVPFTNLKTDPVNFYIGQVLIDISTATSTPPTTTSSNKSSSKFLDKLGNPSKYGLIEKVIDGMRVEVRSVLIFLKDPSFHAQMEMTEILLQSTSPDWQQVPLNKSRVYIDDEDSVINYKLCTWTSLKIEGWSTVGENCRSQNQLRLIVGGTSIRIAFKRQVSSSALLCSRISMHLGDLIWILTQSQLRAVSRLVQSLMDAAVRTQQEKRGSVAGDDDSDSESVDSFESISNERSRPNKTSSGSKNKKVSRSSQRYSKIFQERVKAYMEGRKNLPSHEVIQNSFHLKTGKVDLQLCDDTASSGVEGSLLIQVFQLVVDFYLDQPACSGRAHWNKSNEVLETNTRWSKELVVKASKTQYVDLPSVHLGCLRERGLVVRCADFSIGTLQRDNSRRASESRDTVLPVVAADKKTFNIPDDVHNPAFQVGVSLYFYADKYGNKFLIPRPNVYIYASPVHVNVHQETCLWLAEFVVGVVNTVNVELAFSVKDEGMTFLEERKTRLPQVYQLPGIDLEFKILFTKITLPVPEVVEDGRPKALQIETAAVVVRNSPLHYLLGDEDFECALDVLREGWLLETQESPQFPHYDKDLRALPSRLRDLLQHKTRVGRRRGERSASNESGDGGVGGATALAPEATRSEMSLIEGWHASTSCVQVSFVSTLTRRATLYTTPLINDFPVNAWIFLPPSVLDADLHTPNGPSHLSDQDQCQLPSHQTGRDPRISFVVHIATPMRVEIERLQLLFLMRLKDSLNAFKSSLMGFLDPEAMSPQLKDTLEARKSATNSNKPSISGCVAVSCVEASLLLPSLYTSRPSQATNTDSPLSNEDLAQVLDDSGSSMGPVIQLDSSTSQFKSSNAHLSKSSSQASLSTSESDQNGPVSVAAGANSLLGVRRGSVESLSTEGRTPSPSGSLASLPVILESDVTEPSDSSRPLSSIPPSPVRSVSAIDVHLPDHTKDKLSNSTSCSLSLTVSSSISSGTPPSTASIAPEMDVTVTPSLNSSGVPQSGRMQMSNPAQTTVAGQKSSPSKLSEDEFVFVHSSHPHQPSTDHSSIPTSSTSDTLRVTSTTSMGPSDHTSPNGHTSLTASANFHMSSKSSQLSLSSQRQLKSPAPLRTVPRFVLHAEARHICALPNIEGGAITARVTVDSVSVRELTVQEHEGMKEIKKRKQTIPAASHAPSIKARLEVGNQVKRFYPEDCCDAHDIIVMATVEDLDLTLLLPNIAILKDFFDDEYVADKPLPLHLKVAGTRAVLMESLDHGADHAQSMSVGVAQLEVHRGHELAPGLDIFRQELDRYTDDVLIESSGENDVDGSHGSCKDHQPLRDSYSEFKSAFESRIQDGLKSLTPDSVQVLQSQLQQLRKTLLVPPLPDTPLAITRTRGRSSTVLSSSSELINLRREVENLRHVQRDSERLSAQVIDSQVALDKQMAEFLMVTEECKRVKEELVSYKQVMEKQQEHIDKLLSENFDFRFQLETSRSF